MHAVGTQLGGGGGRTGQARPGCAARTSVARASHASCWLLRPSLPLLALPSPAATPTDVVLLLAHAQHGHLVARLADDGAEHGTRRILAAEAGLDHAGAWRGVGGWMDGSFMGYVGCGCGRGLRRGRACKRAGGGQLASPRLTLLAAQQHP